MYDFILQLFFIGSLSVIVYMMARALPRVAHSEPHRVTIYEYIDNWLSRLPLHHFDNRLAASWEKWLRRTRVTVMKMDNYLLHKINNTKKNGNGNGNSIKELLEKVNSDKS